jgi:hypothetical protein
LQELEFFGPKKVVGVEVEFVEAFLGEALAGRKVGRACRERRKREKGIDGDAANIVEIFGESSGDGFDLLVDLLVFEDECGGIGRRKRRKDVACGVEPWYERGWWS